MIRPGTNCNQNKVLLVALHSDRFPISGESHGICAISGYLSQNFPQIDIETIDLQLNTINDVLDNINHTSPALVGISLKLCTFDQFSILYNQIIRNIPESKRPIIVIGNAIPSFNGINILKMGFKDVIVGIGEGEIVMHDIVEVIQGKKDLCEARNLAYYEKGEYFRTKKEYLSPKLLTLPDRSNSKTFFNLGSIIYIEGSRGCAYSNCKICACRDFLGSKSIANKWRPRPIELIVNDLENLQRLGIGNVSFSDEDFFGHNESGSERINELCNEIIRRNVRVNFRINACVNSVYRQADSKILRKGKIDALRSLKKAGLSKIFIGLESGSITQLRRYGKKGELNEFVSAFNILKSLNIDYELGIILVDPLVTLEELECSLNFIDKNNLVQTIGSVYKELRVQVGHPYISQIRTFEKQSGKRILGSLDFNTQRYAIVTYADERISIFVSLMSSQIEKTYKIYSLLRVFTKFSEHNSNPNICIDEATYIFQTINLYRENEFQLTKLITFCLLQKMEKLEIEKKTSDLIGAKITIFRELESFIKTRFRPEYQEIHEELLKYLKSVRQ